MTQLASTQASPAIQAPVIVAEEASSFTPAQIRQAIAYWVGQSRMDMADALVAAGLSIHPHSQDILAIAALVAEMNQDWAQAQDCLEQLLKVQGDGATAETFHHLVRVMRCRSAFYPALGAARQGLDKYPAHPALLREIVELSALLEKMPAPAVSVATQLG